MKKLIALIVLALAVSVNAAYACTAWLKGEALVTVKSQYGLPRTVRMCYYDHLGEPIVLTLPSYSACRVSTAVRHHNEDRDGDGLMDDEEGNE